MQLEAGDPDCSEGGMVFVLYVSGFSIAGLSPTCYICGQCQVNRAGRVREQESRALIQTFPSGHHGHCGHTSSCSLLEQM